jgi:perosamine synthetase
MKKIKLFNPVVGKEEEKTIKRILKSGFWASGAGTGKVLEFEEQFKKIISSNSCIAVNSGTAALHLALSLFNVKNKEVILPSLSFVSTAHAVMYNGGIPVFADVDPKSLCLSEESIRKNITKKTGAIIPVHFGGLSCNMDKILEIGNKYKIPIIEDAAHAVGTSFKNKKIGSHGNAVCFSFHPVKNLAMPGGGLISLNGNNINENTEILKSKRWCGISDRKDTEYDIKFLGWNYYMNEFSAAIGIEQLKKLDKMNKTRFNIAKIYQKNISCDKKIPLNKECSYHLYWIMIKNRKKFIEKMKTKGIEIGIHYKPIHKMSFYNKKVNLPVVEKAGKEIASLPIYPSLKDDEIEKIIKYTNQYAKF